VDRTVLPGNPAGEAADGVVGAEDRARMALKQGRGSRDNSGRADSRPRAADKIVAMAGRAVPIGKNSADSVPGP
jgi:hypothetical protein